MGHIGPYRLLEILGAGGMGVVYRALHVDTGRMVALKTVNGATTHTLASIRREILALSHIRNPGIVGIVDHGEHEGRPWYAMELLVGRTLHDHLQARFAPLPSLAGAPTVSVAAKDGRRGPESAWRHAPRLSTVLGLLHRICEPLAVLHSHGFVHRDLKPENVFVRDEGQVVLVDLGIAVRFGDSREQDIDDGSMGIVGSLPYMSPEQIMGRQVDARSDLYAMGCILHECLTGRTPFVGHHKDLVNGHLSAKPRPPSSWVSGVPPGLDQLVLRLLQKSPADRLGYAADLAASLVALGAPHPASDQPEPRAYVYRPDLVGRADLMQRFKPLVRATSTRERRVLLGGESGTGKTRLLQELAADAAHNDVLVVGAQCVGAPGELGAAYNAPLQPFRAFLLRVADACRERGAPEAARLLGARARVLSAYEPSLADLPGLPPASEGRRLGPKEARAQVFQYLRDTLFAYAAGRPLLVVVDDLQWADDLTLGFVASLDEVTLAAHRAAVICTYRSEEETEAMKAVGALRDDHGFTDVTLERLDPVAVGQMISGMLALREAPPELTDVLCRHSDGNPFFVIEYLRAAIDQSVLSRDGDGRWQFRVSQGTLALSAASPPPSVRELMARRMVNLPDAALTLARWAAVLGREFDGDLLEETAGADGAAALVILRQRQVLEEGIRGKLRFVHDRLRELAYHQIDARRLPEMHARAAGVLESRHRQGRDLAVVLPALAHHWSCAGVWDRAAHYAARAGNHARDTYANRDAIVHYTAALTALRKLAGDSWRLAHRLVEEQRADVLTLIGECEQARAALRAAVADLPPSHPVWRARLIFKRARTWESVHLHRDALQVYHDAEEALGSSPARRDTPTPAPALPEEWPMALPDESERAWWTQWVELRIERVLNVDYWLADVETMRARVEGARPIIEEHGTPRQRARFFQALAHTNLRIERYVVSPQTIEFARASLAAAEQCGDAATLAFAQFVLAFQLTFSGQLEDALPLMQTALSGAVSTGYLELQARCQTYLTAIHRLRGDVKSARASARTGLDVAMKVGKHDYIGAAHANLGWAAWRHGRQREAADETATALRHWKELDVQYRYPFQWMARIPAMAMALERNEIAEALEHADAMLGGLQHRLPEEVAHMLQEAGETSDAATAKACLRASLQRLSRLGYG